MSIKYGSLNIDNENISMCRCGRPAQSIRPHCPNCGRRNLYSLKRMDYLVRSKDQAGTITMTRYGGRVCRGCGHEFNMLEATEQCDAPILNIKSMEQRRKMDEASVLLSKAITDAGSRKKFLEELLKGETVTPVSSSTVKSFVVDKNDNVFLSKDELEEKAYTDIFGEEQHILRKKENEKP